MFNRLMDNLPRLLFFLGFGFLCGLAPLVIAGIAFYSGKKRGKMSADIKSIPLVQINQLRPGKGLVKLRGKIAQLGKPILESHAAPFAMLRLRAEIWESGDEDESPGWRSFTDKTKTTTFLLNDGSGQVWVNPQRFDKHLIEEGVQPTQDQLNEAIEQLEIDPLMFQRGQFRYFIWQYSLNDTVTVIGPLQQEQGTLWVAKIKDQPMVVSSLPPEEVLGEVLQQSRKANVLALVLGIPGILVLAVSCISLLIMVVSSVF